MAPLEFFQLRERDHNCLCYRLLTGIFIAFALLRVEMFGFIFGFSMFMPLVASICIHFSHMYSVSYLLRTSLFFGYFPLNSFIAVAGHVFACISLSYWMVDRWDCAYFWWVFFLCSFVPGVVEIGVITNMLVVKRIVC